MNPSEHIPYPPAVLPAGVRSRFVDNVNGLTMHMLEAGFESDNRACVVLLHGFPELAYSWRKIMVPIAAAGYHVIAPDMRGYGRTTGWNGDYDGDLGAFRMLNLLTDVLELVSALGYGHVVAVIGHDFGSPVAAYCALLRPDIFRSVVLMSAPFAGSPSPPSGTACAVVQEGESNTHSAYDVHAALAALPRPRKHYQQYYSTREADGNMRNCPQGIHAFLRQYYHHKSADWPHNNPFPLASWTAEELAKLPHYYVMEHDKGMAETVAKARPSSAEAATCRWLTEDELSVYSTEFARTGFQGGLQWYRCKTVDTFNAELRRCAGRTIDVPSCFIAGMRDWGIYQVPGDIEKMQLSVCTKMQGCHLVDGAGHWVQQEQPEAVSRLVLAFLKAANSKLS